MRHSNQSGMKDNEVTRAERHRLLPQVRRGTHLRQTINTLACLAQSITHAEPFRQRQPDWASVSRSAKYRIESGVLRTDSQNQTTKLTLRVYRRWRCIGSRSKRWTAMMMKMTAECMYLTNGVLLFIHHWAPVHSGVVCTLHCNPSIIASRVICV